MLSRIPGFPQIGHFNMMDHDQKLAALFGAVEQIWGSLALTGQQLTARLDALEQRTKGDLEKLAQRIVALEDRRPQGD